MQSPARAKEKSKDILINTGVSTWQLSRDSIVLPPQTVIVLLEPRHGLGNRRCGWSVGGRRQSSCLAGERTETHTEGYWLHKVTPAIGFPRPSWRAAPVTNHDGCLRMSSRSSFSCSARKSRGFAIYSSQPAAKALSRSSSMA